MRDVLQQQSRRKGETTSVFAHLRTKLLTHKIVEDFIRRNYNALFVGMKLKL